MKSIYLGEASLTELLAEVARRFDEVAPVPEWAAPVLFAVAAYYGLPPEVLRSGRRTDQLTQQRHLTISLLAQLHPLRSRAEICAVLSLEAHTYKLSIQRTEERTRSFPEFRREVKDILKLVRETSASYGEKGHCRTSPQVGSPAVASSAS